MVEQGLTTDASLPDLLSLPEEVLYRCIFPLLEYRELLRLRHVCKHIKRFSDEFIRNNFKYKVGEINETKYTFNHFLKTDLLSNSLFLNNTSPAFFENRDIPEFLRLYGEQITSLRVRHFETCLSPHEHQFFSSLPNLQHLDIDLIDVTKRDYLKVNDDKQKVIPELCPFPPNFKNLKTLKLNEVQGSESLADGYVWDLIDYCNSIEYLKHPYFKSYVVDKDEDMMGPFSGIWKCVMDRRIYHPDLPTLKFYDLQNYTEEGHYYNEFILVMKICYDRGVKFLNVHADLLKQVANALKTIPETFSIPILSLRNVYADVFWKEMPNLEKLVIESTAKSIFADTWCWARWGNAVNAPRPEWPSLKILDVNVDSALMPVFQVPKEMTLKFLQFLFSCGANGKERENLRDLAIRYSNTPVDCNKVHLPVPKVKDITRVCPFVTKLTLESWLGTNKAVAMFWEGLPHLEEIELMKCEQLGDVAFVGSDKENPVFLKLKNLKKLSLLDLDLMPKITDLVFKLVFSHLKVGTFCLTGSTPLKSVSRDGIESLITGEFNNSVESFSFCGWSLDGVSKEEFRELELKFRARYMI